MYFTLILMTLGAVISAAVARTKNRNVVAWACFGALCPLPAVAIVSLAADRLAAEPWPGD